MFAIARKVTAHKATTPARAFFTAAATVLLAAVACPAAAHAASADDAVAYSQDASGNRTYYATVEAARTAGYDGATIVMSRDWELSKTFEVADSKTLAIDMNGHRIVGNDKDSAIRVHENAALTLESSAWPTSLQVNGKPSVHSGGVVTRGKEDGGNGGGIVMDGKCTLTLDNVAVAGNSAEKGGGIYADASCNIYIKNGATVTENYAGQYGGGIYLAGSKTDKNTLVSMDNGSVDDNSAYKGGGGIYSWVDNTAIYLENCSTVSYNEAQTGGGIYLGYTHFHVVSKDRTGSVSDNKATSDDNDCSYGGGGIHVEDVTMQKHFGEISGLTLEYNYSAQAGGAISVDQPYTHVSYCNIRKNSAGYMGGGIFFRDNHCSVTSCKVTGNVCDKSGKNEEGGGIFVSSDDDLTLDGVCTIKDNTRGKYGSADDLFLSAGLMCHAYILGGVDAGSEVGIRTGITGDQMVGKKLSTYTDGTYFMDLGNYHLTHGSDHDGDLWQRVG